MMHKGTPKLLALAGAALLCWAAPASAQTADPATPPASDSATPSAPSANGSTQAATPSVPMSVGHFKAWSAFTFEDKGRLMCYTQATPMGTIGKAQGRTEVALMVIQAPDAAAKDQVSVVLGFPPQDGKMVAIRIGRKRAWKNFTLKKFAVGRAWADTDATDQQMVAAMKRSDWFVANMISAKGEKVQDTYNLSGFTDAYNAAVKACQ